MLFFAVARNVLKGRTTGRRYETVLEVSLAFQVSFHANAALAKHTSFVVILAIAHAEAVCLERTRYSVILACVRA